MTEWSPGREFIHRLPAYIMHEFCSVMDSLDSADWGRFASYIVSDMTDLRLLESRGDPGRTQEVMWYWINRNGTVGQLLHLLTSLNLLRARDIILSWRPVPPPSMAPRMDLPPPAAQRPPSATPPSSRSGSEKSFSGKLSEKETATIDSPVPSSVPPRDKLPRPPSPPDSLFTDPGKDPPVSCPATLPSITKKVFYWPLSELRGGTCNFAKSQKIGEGGFGCVYRALMRHTQYAVKRLKEDADLDWKTVRESFYTELEKLYQYRHPNIVDLAGCCVEDDVYCLVYTYMPNGSLQERLRCQDGTAPLSWLQRVEVALGAARALQFMHCSNPSLIHGDVKSSNILLDEHFVPKLGDFGLARFSRYSNNSGNSCTVARTRNLRGTLAYLPDEYIKSGQLAVELDTYSFGVVLLEVLTGRKALEDEGSANSKYLKDILDDEEDSEEESSVSTEVSRSQRVAVKVCHNYLDKRAGACTGDVPLQLCVLASDCLNRKRKKRPKMTKVYERLEKLRNRLRTPPCQEPASLPHTSVPELSDRLQRSSLSPVQNTYRFAAGDTANPALPCSSRDWAAGIRTGPAPVPECTPLGPSSSPSLARFCQPVESDDSSTEHGSRPQHWSLSSSAWHHPSLRPADSSTQVPGSPSRPLVLGQPHGAHASFLSTDSQDSSVPSRQIVVNPAKQKILQQLALYDAGQINSSELLSSAARQERWSGLSHRAPEESDEFD